MLLEIARLFSALYSIGRSRPQYNLVFIVTGAGKLNYQGSKKWLEDQLDSLEGSIIQACRNTDLYRLMILVYANADLFSQHKKKKIVIFYFLHT